MADDAPPVSVVTEANAARIISTWSADWKSSVPRMSAEQLAAKAKDLAHRVLGVQTDYASTSHVVMRMVTQQPERIPGFLREVVAGKHPDVQPHLPRGEHAKDLFTGDATFTVSSNLPEALAFGPFKRGATIAAEVRLSHGPGNQEIADRTPGHPGFTLRLIDPVEKRVQDMIFSAGSSGFVAKDADAAMVALEAQSRRHVVAKRFEKLFGARGGKLIGTVAALVTLVSGLYKVRGRLVDAIGEAMRLARKGESDAQVGKSLAATTYFGKLAFQLGQHAVKLAVVPAPDAAPGLEPSDYPYSELTDDFHTRTQRGPVTYLLKVQGLPRGQEALLADARSEWPSELITIGKITIHQTKRYGFPGSSPRELALHHQAYTPENRWDVSEEALHPIGPIGALRNAIYAASAKLRAGVKCPFGHGGIADGR